MTGGVAVLAIVLLVLVGCSSLDLQARRRHERGEWDHLERVRRAKRQMQEDLQ